MMTEKEYLQKVNLEHRKKYAQFFTPEPIATFMSAWLLHDLPANASILDPAYGLGVFGRALYSLSPSVNVAGYEIDNTIFKYAQQSLGERNRVTLHLEDYLESSWDDHYDGVICNPPYLKFHDYDNGKYIPVVNKRLHTRLNGFTNIYTLFLLKSISQLRNGGRLMYIVPSEFLNADYGVEVKRALLQSGTLRHVVVVDFTQNAFDDALTTACILYCAKDDVRDNEVRFSKIDNVNELNCALTDYTSFRTEELNPELKWKQYYDTTQASNYHHLVPFSTFAKVSRGIATGANQFFTFNLTKRDDNNIPESCLLPCICHAADVQTPIFTSDDFQTLAYADRHVYLLNACADASDTHVRTYIYLGEKAGIDKRYLTASRSPWYAIENRQPAPIWVSVFNRNGLRFVRNKANVYNLTTFHCVYNMSDIDTDILFAYLITDVAKEIFLDNSRQYGNGLVKFEPNDLNKGMVVDLRLLSDDEKALILDVYNKLQFYVSVSSQCLSLLDRFFREKYTIGIADLVGFRNELHEIKTAADSQPLKQHKPRVKQLNFNELFEQYAFDNITENCMVCEDFVDRNEAIYHNLDKNVLISLVKPDNVEHYLDQSAKIYYTGKRFPSTVALNKLYYFMPYIKRKGIRDLYLIKIARIGTRKEGQPDNDPNDFRLVFEIEFVKKFFNDYKPIELEIWHTFTDTNISDILQKYKD